MAYGKHGTLATSWWSLATPVTHVVLAARSYVGATFQFTAPGRICGFSAYVSSGTTPPNWGIIWDTNTGKVVRSAPFRQDVTAPNNVWFQTWMRPWLRIDTSHGYRLIVLMGNGYQRTNTALGTGVTHGVITMANCFQSTAIDPSGTTITTNTNANGVDVLFQAD